MRVLLRSILSAVLFLTATVAVADEASLTAQELQGKHAYDRICIYCHGPGVWGTSRLAKRLDKNHALLENRTDLPAPTIRAIVRAGVGSMPAMRRTEISDADLDAIAAYLARRAR